MNKTDDRFLKVLKEFIQSMIISLVFVILLTQFVIRPVKVEGLSMYPSLNDKEIGVSNILANSLGSIKRFDVVVVYLKDQNKYIVKRVIALPGEEVEYRNEQLYINGKEVDEPFLDTDYRAQYTDADREFMQDIAPIKVPKDHYFLLGDNRPNSIDSRNYGFFERSAIKSKSVIVFLPLNRLRKVG